MKIESTLLFVVCVAIVLSGCDAVEKGVAEHVESDVTVIQSDAAEENQPAFEKVEGIAVSSPWRNIAADAYAWSPEQAAEVRAALDRTPYHLEGELGFEPVLTTESLHVEDVDHVQTDGTTEVSGPTIMSLRQDFSGFPEGISLAVVLQRQDDVDIWHNYGTSQYAQTVGPAGIAQLSYDEVLNHCDQLISGVRLRFAIAAWDGDYPSYGMHFVRVTREYTLSLQFATSECDEHNPLTTMTVDLDQSTGLMNGYYTAAPTVGGWMCAKLTYGGEGIDAFVVSEDLGAAEKGSLYTGSFLLTGGTAALQKIDLIQQEGGCDGTFIDHLAEVILIP